MQPAIALLPFALTLPLASQQSPPTPATAAPSPSASVKSTTQPGGTVVPGQQGVFPLQVVQLQPSTPGTAQVGHVNVTGAILGGSFKGNGSQIEALDAGKITLGMLSDARLSSAVALLHGAQVFTGTKVFSSTPAFNSASLPFSVASTIKVPNLNCDLLDGLDSSAFLQSIPAPLSLVTNAAGLTTITAAANGGNGIGVQGTSTNGVGVEGTATTGIGVRAFSTNGVFGVYALGSTGSGVRGDGAVNGVEGTTTNNLGSGVYGFNGSNGFGVAGRTTGTGPGVYGASYTGSGVLGEGAVNGVEGKAGLAGSGVYGENSANGIGVAGRAMGNNGVGVLGDAQSGVWGLFTYNSAFIGGNLTVGGSKGGYVVDLVQNGGSEPLERGDLVEIAGYAEALVGEIPVIVVRKASLRRPRAVLGPVDCAIELRELGIELPRRADSSANEATEESVPRRLPYAIAGSVPPGGYANVVTLGAFATIKVDASWGPIEPGDPLVASSLPGYAAASFDPAPCTVIGKALGALANGTGTIPVLVNQQ